MSISSIVQLYNELNENDKEKVLKIIDQEKIELISLTNIPPIDTLVYVADTLEGLPEKGQLRHFAGVDGGSLLAYNNGASSHTINGRTRWNYMMLANKSLLILKGIEKGSLKSGDRYLYFQKGSWYTATGNYYEFDPSVTERYLLPKR